MGSRKCFGFWRAAATNHFGEAVQEAVDVRAKRPVLAGLKRLGWTEAMAVALALTPESVGDQQKAIEEFLAAWKNDACFANDRDGAAWPRRR